MSYGAKNKRGYVEDMVLLSKINDDEITENIKRRYMDDLIYTYIGPVLIAVNPFKKLGYFTEKEVIMYQGTAAHENPPHIYALADNMFRNMLIDEESQCVIISGESGAGKTESAKLIMNYIASVSGKGGDAVEKVKEIILESNPLLEAFGNAKTLRNNNSSRFGKYFEIQFNRGGTPQGGNVSNFLLEKSRLVGIKPGERNFHIFYQMTKGATKWDRDNLGMTDASYFNYLRSSNTYDADGINDVADFDDTKKAMQVCGLTNEEIISVFQVTASVLHLGNVDFVEDSGGRACIRDSATTAFPSYLFGVDDGALQAKLISRQMSSVGRRGSNYDVTLNVEQAINSRDALAKTIYSRLFDWLVSTVNKAMKQAAGAGAGQQHQNAQQVMLCLGVLDIYGFEIFEKNGFEQFCINYVNEKLQQIFIDLTLKSEQDEYVKEGIAWTPIDYFNNKIVVDLIESKRPVGIMAVLDDVCATMHGQTEGSDIKFVEKLGMTIGSSNAHFIGAAAHFTIKHYAGVVQYDCDGFTEANKDTLFKDLILLMQSSRNPFIRELFPEDASSTDERKRPTTFSFKIKNQAADLVNTLTRCRPHYVRCIKPNETKRPKDWDGKRVEHQVRYLNLKENIRIRRAGFAFRQHFDKFLRRFGILTRETFPQWTRGSLQDGIIYMMNQVQMESDQYQIGVSKVFVKSPEALFMLEELRERKYHNYAKIIQRAYRKYRNQKHVLSMQKKARAIVYGRKERRRQSLIRPFDGDYLRVSDNPIIKSLVFGGGIGGREQTVLFADGIVKYDRRFKPQSRKIVVTNTAFYLIGTEAISTGPEKGKLVQVIKRQVPLRLIQRISLSTKCDDFVILQVADEYDSVFETLCKTELVTVLSDAYSKALNSPSAILPIVFSDIIQYSVKKTTWSSSGFREITFVHDHSAKLAIVQPSGKGATVRIAPGLPSNSEPRHGALATNMGVLRRSRVSGKPATSPNHYYNSNNQFQQQSNPYQQQYGNNSASMGYQKSSSKSNLQVTGNLSNSLSNLKLSNQMTGTGQPQRTAPVRPPPRAAPPPKKVPTCRAIYAYNAKEADELSIQPGDIVTIINQDDAGWWLGTLKGRRGLFPSNYVEMLN